MATDLKTDSHKVEEAIEDLKIKSEPSDNERSATTPPLPNLRQSPDDSNSGELMHSKTPTSTQRLKREAPFTQSPKSESPVKEEILGGDITVKNEAGKPTKLSRSASHKVLKRNLPLFTDLPDKTGEATSIFQVIENCTYQNKNLGLTDDDSFECECSPEWDGKQNLACGENCLNRMMRVECINGCNCGDECQNQRFQKREWANVSVIQTDKKGYGLRADADLHTDDFIFEYVGEVIAEGEFQKRRRRYDEENIKHFYFMSLSTREFIDATKKGNLGRFCNHSCNPNCYVDKWIVGDKLRMGIFAKRPIEAGEELVFNYNVDRYGADPQPCYCAEPNCLGFLGGKTQTDKSTKLSDLTIAALGLEDADAWDDATIRKPRKRKTGEDDEEYINELQPKPLATADAIAKVMTTLLQCKEKWITVKLLTRLQRAEGKEPMYLVLKMHGYQALKSALSTWRDDHNVVLQVLDVLFRLPRSTKNKIEDSKIEATLTSVLQENEDEKVQERGKALLEDWNSLETAYRIGRKKRDPNAAPEVNIFSQRRPRSRSPPKEERPKSPPRGPAAPTGPKNSMPQRGPIYRPPPKPRIRPGGLPAGWFAAQDGNGKTYYYSSSGKTRWDFPTEPATFAPPPPPPSAKRDDGLDAIIKKIQEESEAKKAAETEAKKAELAEKAAAEAAKTSKKDKWDSMPIEKKKKIYENTIFPRVKAVMDKYRKEIPKEKYKEYFRQLVKKFVESDFKSGRVKDPRHLEEKQKKAIKDYCNTFMKKAIAKQKEHDKHKAAKKRAQEASGITSGSVQTPNGGVESNGLESQNNTPVKHEEDKDKDSISDVDAVMDGSDDDLPPSKESETPFTPINQDGDSLLKRKRTLDGDEVETPVNEFDTPNKRARSETPPSPPPPPPPPPPPAEETSPTEMTFEMTSPSIEGNKRKREEIEMNGDYEGNNGEDFANGASPTKRARSITPPA